MKVFRRYCIVSFFTFVCLLGFTVDSNALQVEYIMSDAPKYSEPGFISLERLITIPNISADGEKEYYIYRTSDIAVDAESNIYILAYMNTENHILKFDNSGKFVNDFAPQGQGPNELDRPRAMQMFNENLYIYGRSQTIKVLDTNGQYVKTLRYAAGSYDWFQLSENTLLYLSEQMRRYPDPSNYLFYNVDLVSQEVTNVIKFTGSVYKGDNFQITPTVAANSKNEIFFTSKNDEYKIKKYDSNGKLLLEFGRSYKRQEFSNETKKSFNEGWGQRVKDGIAPPLAKYTPVVRSIIVDNRDLLWVRIGEWSLDFSKTQKVETVDIFTSDGEFLYTFKTDAIGVLSRIINDKLYSVPLPDENEDHEITVYQIIYLNGK